MKTLMVIETAYSGMYFSLTYLAALIIAAGIVIITGFRKGYPKLPWLLILLTGGMFFIIGEKMFSYSAEQWTQVFTRFYFSPTDKKTILGGIVGLFAGLLISKRILNFKQPVLDNFAIALPVAMAISRIGCLMAGCCYGTPTSLPWGISYDIHSMAYHSHLSQGLIDIHSGNSLTIHPVQLYQVIGCLLIAVIVWMTRKYWRANGSLFLFSVLSYAMLRFLVEFVRDPASSFVLVKQYYGLKAIQWVLLTFIIAGALIVFCRELNKKVTHYNIDSAKVKNFQMGLLTGFLWFVAVVGKNWFTDLELLTICIFLTPVTIAVVVHIYCNNTAPVFRWVFPLIFMGCFIFMSQTTIPTEKDKNKVTFTELGFSGLFGKYYESVGKINSIWVPPYEDPCYGYQPGYYYKTLEPIGKESRNTYQGRIDLFHNKWVGEYYKYRIGAGLFVGSESGNNSADDVNKTSFGISPFVSWDWRYFGVGLGFSLGQMKIKEPNKYADVGDNSNGQIISYEYQNLYFLPAMSLRMGPSDILYLEGRTPALFPSSTVYPMFQVGIGSGLGKTNGTKAAIGYCFDGLYSELFYPIKNKTVLKIYYANNLDSGDDSKSVLSVGISFRFFPKDLTSENK